MRPRYSLPIDVASIHLSFIAVILSVRIIILRRFNIQRLAYGQRRKSIIGSILQHDAGIKHRSRFLIDRPM